MPDHRLPVPCHVSPANNAAAVAASDAQLAETQPDMNADDPATDEPDPLPSRSTERD